MFHHQTCAQSMKQDSRCSISDKYLEQEGPVVHIQDDDDDDIHPRRYAPFRCSSLQRHWKRSINQMNNFWKLIISIIFCWSNDLKAIIDLQLNDCFSRMRMRMMCIWWASSVLIRNQCLQIHFLYEIHWKVNIFSKSPPFFVQIWNNCLDFDLFLNPFSGLNPGFSGSSD